MIAEGDLDLSPSHLRGVLCRVLRKLPDQSNWSEYPNIWGECQNLLKNCLWYKVYDFVEALYDDLSNDRYRDSDAATRWQELINEYFLRRRCGLGGWSMASWKVVGLRLLQ